MADVPAVLIVGLSTRAAADSASRAGFAVTALDAFGDLDQSSGVRALSLSRDFGVRFSASAAARVARTVACDAVAYLSSFENHPAAVRTLAKGRTLWGNSAAVLARVRDPGLLAATLARRGFAVPAIQAGHPFAPDDSSPSRAASTQWLIKPRASGGGHRIRAWQHGESLPRGCYRQELIEGTPGSIVFVAANGHATPLGLTRQVVGDASFGASGFRYCGNILAPAGDAEFDADATLSRTACGLTSAVAEEFGLVGVAGVDFVARDGIPYPVEVNPRYSASMEIVELCYGLSVFAAHAAACTTGGLPAFDLASARRSPRAAGKAIVFARHDVVCGDARAWLDDPSVRDVPHPGEQIPAGHPVCTVFASGANSAECYSALVKRAGAVYETLEAWASVAA